MKKEQTQEQLVGQIDDLKKDVYFSYVLKLNHRYIFKDLYSTIERINYINTNVNQYYAELESLNMEIDSDNIEFSNSDIEELNKVKRTKEVSMKELELFIKKSKDFLGSYEIKKDELMKSVRIIAPILVVVIFIVKDMV